MDMIIKAIILGIIEGLTEFLPVSSTGHLIIANKYLQFTGDFANLFAVVIQGGAILAVIVFFKDKLIPKFSERKHMESYISLWLKVCVGIIPAGILGVLFEDKIEEYLFNAPTVAVALIFGAILLILAEKHLKTVKVDHESKITYKQAFIVGIAQCMALIPGMSRSASTIIGALMIGFSRAVAAEFSFFLAIPTILGASFIKLIKTSLVLTQFEILVLAIGTIVSYIVAYYVIALFMNYIKKHDLKVFGYYRIILGIIVLLLGR